MSEEKGKGLVCILADKRDQVICSPTKLSFESISRIGERYV